MTLLFQVTSLVRRVLTAVVAVVVLEVVGLGAFLLVLRPGVLATLTSSESTSLAKAMAVLGSPLLLLLSFALAGIGVAYAARSDSGRGSDATTATTSGSGESSAADEGGFSFEGE